MDADERLTALKRAYADIILNTAKEAAARIMVSERKALRFQQELNATKEQALQMLLRLKQMMDSKVSEVEMTCLSQQRKIVELEGQLRAARDAISEAAVTSLSQQRKIEELEAQLHEAEDIVKDLREELREVQAEQERVRSNKLQHTGECDTAPQEQTSLENGFNNCQSIVFSAPASQLESVRVSDIKSSAINQRNECYSGNDCRIGNSYTGKPALSSKSEENRLNISQSIVFPPPKSQLESFTASDMKSSAFNKLNEAYKCYNASDSHLGNLSVGKPDLPSIVLRIKKPELYRNRRTQRIRAFEEKLMAGELSFADTVDDVNYKTNGSEDEEVEGICKTPTYKANNMCTTTEKKVAVQADRTWHQVQKVRTSSRKRLRTTTYKKSKTLSCRYLPNQVLKKDQSSDTPCSEAKSISESAQCSGDPSHMAPGLSADKTYNSILLKCTKEIESDSEFVKARSIQNSANKDQASTDKLLLVEPISGSAVNLGVPICGMDAGKLGLPVVNSGTKTFGTPDGISDQPVTDRVFKYTFQRKRKKESLSSSDGNVNAEEDILNKKTAANGPLQMVKSSSITESSRDSRRVAQVARQLISLSEKKWWQ